MNIFKKLFAAKSFECPADLLPRRFSLLDIGARWGLQRPWNSLRRDLLAVILVEPDPLEAEKLRKELNADGGSVLPFALWREEATLSLKLNRSPGTSSLYTPNRQFLSQFPDVERFDVLKTIEISTVTIDGLASSGQIPNVDFAKIDVQGAELAILEGGRRHLAANLAGLEVEVEFAELYAGQPLFGDVEAFVREELGLELWDLRKTYWKYEQGKHVPGPVKGRMVFGDALFLRPLSGIEKWLSPMLPETAKEKGIMLVVTALTYGYVDYATAILNEPSLGQYFDLSIRHKLQCAVNSVGAGFHPFPHGNRYLFALLDSLARAFQPTHAGWAYGGRELGSRRRGPFWS